MTKKKIQQLTNFFYSSNDVNDIPIRLSITTGYYSGFNLSKQSFIELLTILNNSVDLKEDLENFRDKYEG